MILKIQNFRCHKNVTYEFLESSVNLISGDSGAGKTTILNALKWCLFGKIKSIVNNADAQLDPHSKPKSIVTLSWGQFSITRTTNPGSLLFTGGGINLESEAAQNKINEIFNVHKIWNAACNIDQGELHPLITDSEKDKIDLLQNLSFNGESPETIITKVSNSITKTKMEFEQCQIQYYADLKAYNEFAELHKVNLNQKAFLSDILLSQVNNRIPELQKNISELEDQLITFNKNCTIKETYEQEKLKCGQKLGVYVDLSSRNQELKELNLKIPIYQEHLKNVQLNTEKQKKIADLEAKLSTIPTLTEVTQEELNLANTELAKAQNLYNELKQKNFYYQELVNNRTLLMQCQYLPDLDVKEQRISKLQELKIAHQKRTANIELKTKLEAERATISYQIQQIPSFDLQIINQKIQEYNEFLKFEQQSILNSEYRKEINNLSEQLSKLPIPDNNYLNLKLTEKEISDLEIQTILYNTNLILAQNLGIPYQKLIVDQQIAELKYLLDIQPEINKYLSSKELIQKINQINVAPVNKNEINEIRRKLDFMKSSNDILECPHCKSNLKLFNAKLIKSDEKSYTAEDIAIMSQTLATLETNYSLNEQKALLSWELNNLGKIQEIDPKFQLSTVEIEAKSQRLLELQKLVVVEKPTIDIKLLKSSLVYRELYYKIQELQGKIIAQVPDGDWNKIKTELNSLQETLKNAKNWEAFHSNLSINLVEVESKLKEIQIADLEAFDQNELTSLIALVNFYRVENSKYQNIQENIKNLTQKYQIQEDVAEQLVKVEQQILELTAEAKKLSECHNLYQKYASEKKLYTEELQKYIALNYPINPNLPYVNQESIKKLETEANKLNQEIQQFTISNSLWLNYTNELKELDNKISNLIIDYTINDKLNIARKELETLKKKLEDHELYMLYQKKYTYITDFRNKCLKTQETLTDLMELHKLCLTVERECLEGTVAQINADLSNICNTIFDSDIEVLLSLYKPLKNEKEKECVNVHILNKGIKYEFKELSGGQKARVSLALTIALSLTSNSPIIILDEALTSLDATAREKCLKIIKHYTRKTVIMVNHVEVEGQYDNVIKI